MPASPILVTGASGFVAIHTILQLLEQGYNVRGTIRSLSKESEVRGTISKYVQANDRLEFTPADLRQDAGWDEAMKNVGHVLHVASPFPLFEPKHEDELIIPAVQGTLRVLRAAHKAKVRRVVQVSSNAAISSGHEGENKTFTEADWTNPDKVGAYAKSKTLAERAAWEFINGAENTEKMELAVINPPLILGPIPNKNLPTSAEMIRVFMRGEVPGVARLKMGIVDVRDVASAIILAMQTPEAAGQRFACPAATMWYKDIADILRRGFANAEYKKIPRIVFPNFLVRVLALFDKKIALVVSGLDWDYELSNEKARRILKWTPRPKEEAIISMAKSLIEQGFA
ncbi:MAG: aldehyde reductase [Anaerolineales bacterium]|nr:MAG: aldehyde reductase [Anaerolineales bacterium]